MYDEYEMDILRDAAIWMYGRSFEELDFEEQDALYCWLADEGRI